MNAHTLATEAVNCRKLAIRYSGRPEHQFLLNVAAVFEELAQEAKSKRRSS